MSMLINPYVFAAAAAVAAGWDITTASYVSTKDVSAQDGSPFGIAFSPDGLMMFMVGYSGDNVYRYDLSTAWDITSATYVSSKYVRSQDSYPYDVTFSGDGAHMFVLGGLTDSVYRYNLSAAWDITTASYVSTKDVSAQDGSPRGIAFSPDGLMMFMVGYATDSVYRYNLSPAWDITTASYTSLKSVTAQDTAPQGVTFSPDGTKMFVAGGANDSVYRYDLTTAWDITTASYVSLKSVSAQDTYPYGIRFSGDGTIMLVGGATGDSVYRYDL